MDNNRTRRSIKNSATALLGQAVTIVLNFAVRTVFIKTLGAAYLGINGLFTNILSVLSFAEIGFGTAIVYAMYAPLAKGDEDGVSRLMNYFAKVYQMIGIFIYAVGLILIPFLNFFINDTSELPAELPALWIVYLLYLSNTALSYFFNYKRSLIIASQNGHLDSLNQLYFNLIKGTLQVIALFLFKDFLSYLVIQIACTVLGNYSISRKADKLFPYLAANKGKKISEKDRKSIGRNVFAMSFSRLGSVVITGVDDLLISKFVGIIAMGVYSNYLLLTNTLKIVFIQMLAPVTASVGNFVTEKTNEESYHFFKKLYFINAYLAICCFISLNTLINPFIKLIWGENYVLAPLLTFLITFNFYLDRMRTSSQIFIDATGLFWPIKWKSLFEAAINLSCCLYFLVVLKWGIESIVIGTIISNLTTNIWWEPYVVFRYKFGKKLLNYFQWMLQYTAILGISYGITVTIHGFFSERLDGFILKGIVSLLIPNLIIGVFYFKTTEYQSFLNIIKRTLNRRF